VLVVDIDVLEEQLRPGDEEAEALEQALENSAFEEWEEFRVIAREPDAWDDAWSALLALDRDHHDRLREILEKCCEMTLEYISGQGGFFQVLTADEMLESDVTAARDDRRSTEGFISPADARAFLELARRRDGGVDERDAITRAYFRELRVPTAPSNGDGPRKPGASEGGPAPDRGRQLATASSADARDLEALLQAAGVIAPPPRSLAALPAMQGSKSDRSHVVAPLFEQAMRDLHERDPLRFAARVQEVGYLVNVWIAGGAHDGRRPRPTEAMEVVLETCEAGLRAQLGAVRVTRDQALIALMQTPADALFRRGFR
jgi:hypothetical protein